MNWWSGELAGFDLETTGVDVETDRIVSAYLGGQSWLVDPGVPIPASASAIHGITTEDAQRDGVTPTVALDGVYFDLVALANAGTPIVGFNVAYDLTLLSREFMRHGSGCIPMHLAVVDLMVLDKAVSPYRRGSRKLAAVAEHYGVVLEGAHDAGRDAEAAVAATRVLLDEQAETPTPVLDLASPFILHQQQVRARWRQQVDLEAYLRRKDPSATCDPHWPVKPPRQNS